MPIDLGAVGAEDELGRRARDLEPPENRRAAGRPVLGPDEDEIRVQEILELGIGVNLLTQQDAAPSATRVEIEKDELLFRLGLRDGLVDRPREPVLGRRG